MRFRMLSIGLSQLWVLVVAATVAPAGAPDERWQGTVTMCRGTATVDRDGEPYRVVRGAGLRSGDRIETDGQSEIMLVLDRGPVLMLAPETSIAIARADAAWRVIVQRGETRLVHDGKTDLRLGTREVDLAIDRAIVRLERQRQHTVFELVAGEAACRVSSSRSHRAIDRGRFSVDHDGQLRRVEAIDWQLQPGSIRLAAAVQTSPVVQPPQPGTNDATRGSSPDEVSPPIPPSPDADDEDEDEEEEPRLAQQQPAAAARGGLADGADAEAPAGGNTSTFGGSSSLSLGSLSGGTGSFFSGGIFGDANQQTFEGQVDGDVGPFTDGQPFPGAIHLVAAENRLSFNSLNLSATEIGGIFPSGMTNKFYSIFTGPAPTGQVVTNFFTGTGPEPKVIDVPRFNAGLVLLDQYALPQVPDPSQTTTDPTEGPLSSNIGLTGLVGPDPTGPTVVGTTPLVDQRAELNEGVTFALGEFLVTRSGSDGIAFAIRRSDQDRLIVKDPGGNDAEDQVTPNSEVEFVDAVDPRFLPQSPTVKVPESLSKKGTSVTELNFLRRAALTTLMADQLQDFSRRTGQTRFVADGKIIDISGYRPQ